jgi:hypothetical protein
MQNRIGRMAATSAAVAACLAGTAPAHAATEQQKADAVARGIGWIKSKQDAASGSLGGFGGDWAMSAFAAGGVHPADTRVALASPSAQDYYFGSWTANATGPGNAASDFERAILAGEAGGLQSSRLAPSQNLVARLAGTYDGRQLGSDGLVNDDMFGVLALARTAASPAVLDRIARFVRSAQVVDGGWNFGTTSSRSDVDMTGAGMAALCAAGATPADPAIGRATTYLKNVQNAANGGFTSAFFGVNTDTTAWAVSGLIACGIDPQSADWTTSAGKTPVDFLVAQQNADGSFQYRSGDGAKNLYSTQAAIRPLAGGAFSAEPPARADASQPRVRPAPAVADGTRAGVAVTIDDGSNPVRLCQTTAAVGASVSEVLESARIESRPTYCVSDLAVEDGEVERLNGVAADTRDGGWRASVDGGSEEPAGAERVDFGDALVLRFEPGSEPRRPLDDAGVTPGQQGTAPTPDQLPPLQAAPGAATAAVLPRLTLSWRGLRTDRHGYVRIAARCPAGTGSAGCRGVVTARARLRGENGRAAWTSVGDATFAVGAGKRGVLKLRLTTPMRRTLGTAGRRPVRFVAAARDPLSGALGVGRATVSVR